MVIKYCLLIWIVFLSLALSGEALQCYRCGDYTEDLGSVTPCFDFSEKKLEECPPDHSTFCIKYVHEAVTVRQCSAKCDPNRGITKGWSEDGMYCCTEDGCNSAPSTNLPALLLVSGLICILNFLL